MSFLSRWCGRRDLAFLVLGIVAGGYLFADSRPRSFLAVHRCEGCWRPEDLAGLLASVVVQRAPGLVPMVVAETDRTLAVKLPTADPHFVVIPKRDIPDVGQLAGGDEPYLVDAYAVIGRLVRESGLKDYTVLTNGPARQDVTYLHFHVVSRQGPMERPAKARTGAGAPGQSPAPLISSAPSLPADATDHPRSR